MSRRIASAPLNPRGHPKRTVDLQTFGVEFCGGADGFSVASHGGVVLADEADQQLLRLVTPAHEIVGHGAERTDVARAVECFGDG